MRDSHDAALTALLDNGHDAEDEMRRAPVARNGEPGRVLSVIGPRVERDGPIPLSYSQERLWFLDRLGLVGAAYNVLLAVRLIGRLEIAALEHAFVELVSRHEGLRTRFGVENGTPHQLIDSRGHFELRREDLSYVTDSQEREGQLRECMRREQLHGFDLSEGPLLRVILVTLSPREHALVLTVHHVVADGWSIGVLMQELGALYGAYVGGQASPLPGVRVQYADYATWQRQWLQGDVLQAQLAYWKNQLVGGPKQLELPTDRPRPAVESFRGASVKLALPRGLLDALKQLGRHEGVTLFMVVLTAFQVLLARWSGERDIVVGAPIAGRRRETEPLIGSFVNMLALRTHVAEGATFSQLLQRVKQIALGAYKHQDLPFERLVMELRLERDLARQPVFQVVLAFENFRRKELDLPDLACTVIESEVVASPFDLALFLREAPSGLVGEFQYATDLFEPSTIERLARHFEVLLKGIVEAPAQRVERLPLLPEEERQKLLVEWNATAAAYPRDRCIHELFEEQAEKTPDAVAAVYAEEQLTYGELRELAGDVAARLQEAGVKPNELVGIRIDKRLEQVIAVLGVLMSGAAYLPVDPSWPKARQEEILAAGGVAVLLKAVGDRSSTPAGMKSVKVEATRRRRSYRKPAVSGVRATDIAYVIFTSGSTGKPKGVTIEHRSVVNTVVDINRRFGVTGKDRVLALSALTFDLSVYDVLGMLAAGGSVVLPAEADRGDPGRWAELVRAHGVTVWDSVPALFQLLVEHLEGSEAAEEREASTLRMAWLSGDWIPVQLPGRARKQIPGIELHSLGGATEGSIWSVTYPIAEVEPSWTSVPYGKPLSNQGCLVLDDELGLCPVGVAGDLYLTGDGVARGYWGDEEQTARSFFEHPSLGMRMYRTGDRARYLADGNLEFLGRQDDQVKIRGFRIELGEIEARLLSHEAVRVAVVMVLGEETDRYLSAYVVPAGEEVAEERARADELIEKLQAHLKEQLPSYMVPSFVTVLPALPLTANGKVDRKALPAPQGEAYRRREYQAPAGEVETALAQIWQRLLRVERVGRHDDFFELGGHSLLATRLVSEIREAFAVELPLKTIFDVPRLTEQAKRLAQGEGESLALLPPIEAKPDRLRGPLSFAQQRLWFLSFLDAEDATYNIPMALELTGPLDEEVLERALGTLVERHATLRTVFEQEENGEPVQVVRESVEFWLRHQDLSSLREEDQQTRIAALAREEALRPFDLRRDLMLRATLLKLSAERHVLLLTQHHIASDGYSSAIVVRELSALYGAYRAGEPSPLPALPVQYIDFAAWQREWLQGEVLERELGYWREQLAGIPAVHNLPLDKPRPAEQSFRGAHYIYAIDAPTAEGLRRLSREHGATLFMTLQAAFAAFLSRYSGKNDIVMGTSIANRAQRALESIVGFFLNALVLRTELTDKPRFTDLLMRVKDRTLSAYAHQQVPFELLVEKLNPPRSLSHSPLFQVMLVWQGNENLTFDLPGLRVAPLTYEYPVSRFDLTVHLIETSDGLETVWQYASDLFEPRTVERMARHWGVLLKGIVGDPKARVTELPLLAEEERHQLLSIWNDTAAPYPRGQCLHELIETQAEKTPERLAVVCGDRSISYRQLNERANRLAHYLMETGVVPETLVGLCAERSVETIVGVLGILKTGGAYLPLDSEYPAERLRYMMRDAGITRLVTQTSLRRSLFDAPELNLTTALCLDADADNALLQRYPASNPRRITGGLGSEHLAYVIYTSGSSGAPKGAMIPHRSIVNYVCAVISRLGLEECDSMAMVSTIAADLGHTVLFGALCSGSTLHLLPRDCVHDPKAFAEYMATHGIEALKIVPTHLRSLLAHDASPGALPTKILVLGGEASDCALVEDIRRRRPHCRIVNHYGPTETTVGVLTYEVKATLGAGATSYPVPLGRPLPNSRVYVVDEECRMPVPIGVAGELCIAGDCVGRGYLNQPILTARSFVDNPFEPGTRLYRTGDRARWRADGTVEYLGRIDHQIKVRGFRVELGEIEACLSKAEGVQTAVLTAQTEAEGDQRLVAFLVPSPGQDEQWDDEPAARRAFIAGLRAHLSRFLPNHMLPAAYVIVSRLPLTANGKVDRQALSAADGEAYSLSPYVPPVTDDEKLLCNLWQELLGLEEVGVTDSFFDVGGHSLLATRLISRVRDVFGVELSLKTVFDAPRIRELARAIMSQRSEATHAMPPIRALPGLNRAPASFAQQRLWLLSLMNSEDAVYNRPVTLDVNGALDVHVLRRVFDTLLERHATLRTVFEQDERGQPIQVIRDECRIAIVHQDLSGSKVDQQHEQVRAIAGEQALRPFDLSNDVLLRVRLLKLSSTHHVLVMTLHHIASDGWSLGVLVGELSQLYAAYSEGRASPLPALPVRYIDFAVWQREWLQGEVLERELGYWREQLAGVPAVHNLPLDKPRPAEQSFRGTHYIYAIDAPTAEGLQRLGREHGATLFMTLQAAFAALLSRYSGEIDIVMGTVIANRVHKEVEPLIGFFINTLVMRADLSGDPTFVELLRATKERTLEAYAHQHVPFELLVEALNPPRSLSHAPLFQVMLVLQNNERSSFSLPGLTVTPMATEYPISKFDLTLHVVETEEGLVTGWEYATDLFESSTIERMARHFEMLLKGIVAEPAQRVEQLPLLPEEERQKLLVEWNATAAPYPRDRCIHELFEEQAEKTPDAVAAVYEDTSLTYRQLNGHANRLAHYLRDQGVSPDARVGICVERGLPMVVGLLGILKAGGAYVPLDPSYPGARLQYLLSDSKPVLLLVDEAGGAALADGTVAVSTIDLRGDAPLWAGFSSDNPIASEIGLNSGHLAYVIYTSGSTGQPKGVMIEHRNVVNYLTWAKHAYYGQSGNGSPTTFSIGFDAQITTFFGALLSGQPLDIFRGGADIETLAAKTTKPYCLTKITPSHLKLLNPLLQNRSGVGPTAALMLGGEPAVPADVAFWQQRFPNVRLINHFGPTETTVGCCTFEITADVRRLSSIPIGRPIANARIYLLDRQGKPVPLGAVGEIHIGGAGVARGYFNRPVLTAERFIDSPFVEGDRLYKTGDLARYRPDGNVVFLGRNDEQVKVRGYRIELGEIQSQLARLEGIREAVVVAREDEPGEKRLVAYYTPCAGTDAPDVERLREHLEQVLPQYMVPAAYVRLERLPLTPNGKLDRKALPAPEGDAYRRGQYEAPHGEVETALAQIWQRLLRVERVGRHDDFFELGGHSLLATRLVSEIREAFAVELPLKAIFDVPRLTEQAKRLAQGEGESLALLPPIEAKPDRLRGPLSFAQQRLWFLSFLDAEDATYNIPMALELTGPLDEEVLERALGTLVERHATLRTVFEQEENGEPVQVVRESVEFWLRHQDLSSLREEDQQTRIAALAREEALRPFDLRRDLMLRASLLELGAERHVLLLTQHHIASDGYSSAIVVRELSALYGAYVAREPSPLPALPVQYIDFAAWQREWLQGEVLERELGYWREQLAGIPAVHNLRLDKPRPAEQSFRGTHYIYAIDAPTAEGLQRLGREHGATLFMTLQAAFAALLSRYSGEIDIVMGTVIANRVHKEVEPLIGFFINTLVMRADLSGDPTFVELLRATKERTLEAYAHQHVPFELLVEALNPPRSLSHAPLFQVMLVLQNNERASFDLPGLSVQRLSNQYPISKFDLTLHVVERDEGLVTVWEYATDLFEPSTIERLARHFEVLLKGIVEAPAQWVGRLPLLPEEERQKLLVEWNATAAAYPRDRCIHELFEEQAEKTPDAVAAVYAEEQLTYGELRELAGDVAARLQEAGVKPNELVGIRIDKRLEQVIAVLGVLMSGAAYLPVDPSWPKARQEEILAAGGVAVLLKAVGDRSSTPAGMKSVKVEATRRRRSYRKPAVSGVRATDIAYVIFTSGSTGKPKGVTIEHRSVVNTVVDINRRFGVTGKDRVLALSALTFDLSVYDVLGMLAAGGSVVLPAEADRGDPGRWAELVRAHGVTVWDSVPALFQLLVEHLEGSEAAEEREASTLRMAWLSGDWIPVQLPGRARKQIPGIELHSLGGATEGSIWSVTYPIAEVEPSWTSVPYGKPLSNQGCLVLDGDLGPCPVGVAGDLYLTGDGVARGYWGDEEQTARSFFEHPSLGMRMYRTGDRARYLADGNLEFLGRQDDQVKIRGFRIELGEIEARLLSHEAVRVAVVMVLGEETDRYLSAYVVPAGEEVAEERARADELIEKLQAHLKEQLPSYMVPSFVTVLPALPLTANGKVDRKALPAPQGEAYRRREYQAPAGEVETALAQIWQRLLRVERVGRHDDFFELGGHSLLATRLVSEIREAFAVELPLKAIFDVPRLTEQAKRLAQGEGESLALLPPIEAKPDRLRGPLSFAQQRLWFLSFLDAEDATYNIPMALELTGPLDEEVLERALGTLVERHATLRTVFEQEENGEPVQVVRESVEFWLRHQDLGSLGEEEQPARIAALAREEALRPFDLRRDLMLRASLLELGAERHVLLLTQHHIASDGYSSAIVVRELSALYGAYRAGEPSPLPALPVQYIDFAAWQREWLQGEVLERELGYWREQLAGIPAVHNLPLDKPRPAEQSFRGAHFGYVIDAGTAEGLQRLGREHGATLFMTLQAAFATLLSRYSGESDIVMGTAIANRVHKEVEPLIGFFVNTLVMRADLSGDPSFEELLGATKERTLEAYAHQHVPFELLVEELNPPRSLSHAPLFQVMLVLQNNERASFDLPGLSVQRLSNQYPISKFDLTLHVVERDEGLVTVWEYATDLFEPSTIERLARHFEVLLKGIVEEPARRVGRLPLLVEEERQKLLVEWNATAAAYPRDRCIHELFEEQAEKTPDAVAVVYEDTSLTYRQLNEQANRLAHYLRDKGVGPDARVGICVERGWPMVVGLLGILKAGGAYVPLDPTYPAARLQYLLSDSEPILLLLDRAGGAALSDESVAVPTIDLEADTRRWAGLSSDNPSGSETGLSSRNLAYMIYTSGSTGQPKGVMVEHRGVSNYLSWSARTYSPDRGALVSSSLNFDATVTSLWTPLIYGSATHLLKEGEELQQLEGRIRDARGVGLLKVTPAHLDVIDASKGVQPPSAARGPFVIGGEALLTSTVDKWRAALPDVRLINEYGPTETVVGCVVYEIPRGRRPSGNIPIGRPIANTRIYILDRSMQPVPIGVEGEIYIGGAGVARGYWKRPELTAERFLSDPFSEDPEARLYRTGDLGRFIADGNIEYLGRNDHQVKIRGHRIELGEIEAQLAKHARVKEAVVLAREDEPGEKRLVAYYTTLDEADVPEAACLRTQLEGVLPSYMVPAAYVRLERLPLTPNGKLDRKALPAPEYDAYRRGEYEAPQGEIETTLAEIWQQLLRVARVGRRDNFFELGGHSLLAVTLIERLRCAELRVDVRALFTAPTLSSLAALTRRIKEVEL